MKKLILLLALGLLACKKETPQPECNCNEVYSRKFISSGWAVVSTTPIDVECWRHNEVTSEWQTTDPVTTMPIQHKKVIICE